MKEKLKLMGIIMLMMVVQALSACDQITPGRSSCWPTACDASLAAGTAGAGQAGTTAGTSGSSGNAGSSTTSGSSGTSGNGGVAGICCAGNGGSSPTAGTAGSGNGNQGGNAGNTNQGGSAGSAGTQPQGGNNLGGNAGNGGYANSPNCVGYPGEGNECFTKYPGVCNNAPMHLVCGPDTDGVVGISCHPAKLVGGVWQWMPFTEIPGYSPVEFCDGLDNNCNNITDENCVTQGGAGGSGLGGSSQGGNNTIGGNSGTSQGGNSALGGNGGSNTTGGSAGTPQGGSAGFAGNAGSGGVCLAPITSVNVPVHLSVSANSGKVSIECRSADKIAQTFDGGGTTAAWNSIGTETLPIECIVSADGVDTYNVSGNVPFTMECGYRVILDSQYKEILGCGVCDWKAEETSGGQQTANAVASSNFALGVGKCNEPQLPQSGSICPIAPGIGSTDNPIFFGTVGPNNTFSVDGNLVCHVALKATTNCQ
jgi:hypothetical protein